MEVADIRFDGEMVLDHHAQWAGSDQGDDDGKDGGRQGAHEY